MDLFKNKNVTSWVKWSGYNMDFKLLIGCVTNHIFGISLPSQWILIADISGSFYFLLLNFIKVKF